MIQGNRPHREAAAAAAAAVVAAAVAATAAAADCELKNHHSRRGTELACVSHCCLI